MISFRPLFRDRSFAYKFTLLTTIPVIIVAACIALVATTTFEQSVTEATFVRVKRNTYLAALSMSNPYVIYNKALLDSFVDSLKQEKGIIYAFVVDYNDGRILAHSDHAKDGQYFDAGGAAKIQISGAGTDGIAQLPGTGYEAVSPIHIAGDLFGTVRVGYTLNAVHKEIASLRVKIIIITLLAILFSLIFSVLLARVLSKPILSLASQAQDVADGNFEQDITYESRDVVGRLSRVFKKMTEELRERLYLIESNEKKYRSLFEASNDAVLILNEGKIIDCNQQTLELFRGESDDILHKTFNDLSPEKQPDGSISSEIFKRRIRETLSGSRHRFYWKHICLDRTELDAEVSLSPTSIADKKMVLAVVQDITERKAAEAEIENFSRTLEKRVEERTRELENAQEAMLNLVEDLNTSKNDLENSKQDLEIQKTYLEQLFEASTEAIVFIDEKDRVVRVNRQFTDLFGFAPEEVIGKSLDDTIIPKEQYDEGKKVKGAIKKGKKLFHETLRKRRDGSLVDVSITGMPIRIYGEEAGVYAIYRNISDRKKVEKALKKAQGAADAANRAKGEFLANMSHEIRTPLNAIVGLNYLAMQTDLTPQQHDYLLKINSSAEALLTVINDILDFSKIEAGKLDMESSEFYLEDVLNKVADMVSMKADEKGLEFVLNTDGNAPQELVGDPLRLGQVLVNLIGNAIKFTEKGEVVVRTRLVEDQGDQAILKFEVQDTGIGLSKKQMKRLFQAFSQADTSTTRKFGGTGLGLVICQRIVGMMGGDIELQSELGKGSTFSFTAVLGRHNKKRQVPLMLADDFKNMRALVVDDSRTARQNLKHILETIKLQVTLARSGQEAMQIIEKDAAQGKSFDMVFTDFKMPLMDGIETARQIKTNQDLSHVPIIIMVTAYGRDEVLRQAEQIGLDGFITKPVSSSTILDSIMTAFRKKPVVRFKEGLEPTKVTGGLAGIAGARILLAEDNEVNQQVACELLSSVGLEVTVANNGNEVLESLKNEKFDAILMDVQMPVMDGLTAAKKIRSLNSDVSNIPIVALTAHAMAGDREKSIQAGMNDHVTKPLDPEELFKVLVNWIEPKERPLKKAPAAIELQDNKEIFLPELPGIDIVSALTRVGGNPDALIRLLKKFAAGHANAVDVIANLLRTGEIKEARKAAHTLKGVSGNISAVELNQSALKLEQAIKEERTDEYEPLLDSTGQLFNRVLASIHRLDSDQISETVNTATTAAEQPLDMKNIDATLSDLKKLLKNNSFSSGKQVDALADLLKGSHVAKELADVKNHVDRYRFKEALQAVDKLAKALKE